MLAITDRTKYIFWPSGVFIEDSLQLTQLIFVNPTLNGGGRPACTTNSMRSKGRRDKGGGGSGRGGDIKQREGERAKKQRASRGNNRARRVNVKKRVLRKTTEKTGSNRSDRSVR